ncbi:MAG: hypothetical protein IJD33_06645, partial [Clostridia bacterium]|nr:hypothetical protein [Clostridia bacterium]
MKKMKKFVALFLAIGCSASMFACNSSGELLAQDEYQVEYGETFAEYPEGDFEVTVTDADGKNVRTQKGKFTPAVGEYTAVYKQGKKTQTVKIICKDTLGPTVTFDGGYEVSISSGKEVEIPYYRAEDISGVESQSLRVLNSDGEELTLSGEGTWFAETDTYTVEVTAKDKLGNTTVECLTVVARDEYVDPLVKADILDDAKTQKRLFTFDNDEYINLVRPRSGKEAFQPSIVYEGFPALEGAPSGNGALQLTSELNYGDAFMELITYGDACIPASKAKKFYARVAANKDTEYIKITDKEENKAGSVHQVKANTWYVIEVEPIKFGYGWTFSEFMVQARIDEGLTVWVDEIWYDAGWEDPNLEEGVLGDFNETEYVDKVHQNIYNGIAYSAGGSLFDIVQYPKDEARTVLKVTTTRSSGGFTYMFDERVALEDIESVTVVFECSLPASHLWMSGMQGTYRHGASYSSLLNYGEQTS